MFAAAPVTCESPPATTTAAPPDYDPQNSTSQLPPTFWLIDSSRCGAYDGYVDRHRDATVFHGLAWRRVLAAFGAGRACYIGAMRGDRFVGVLPLFEQADAAGVRRLISLPHTPAAGPLADDARVARMLVAQARRLRFARDCDSVVLRGVPGAAARCAEGGVAGDGSVVWGRIVLVRDANVLPGCPDADAPRVFASPWSGIAGPEAPTLLRLMGELGWGGSNLAPTPICIFEAPPAGPPRAIAVVFVHARRAYVVDAQSRPIAPRARRAALRLVLPMLASLGVGDVYAFLPRGDADPRDPRDAGVRTP